MKLNVHDRLLVRLSLQLCEEDAERVMYRLNFSNSDRDKAKSPAELLSIIRMRCKDFKMLLDKLREVLTEAPMRNQEQYREILEECSPLEDKLGSSSLHGCNSMALSSSLRPPSHDLYHEFRRVMCKISANMSELQQKMLCTILIKTEANKCRIKTPVHLFEILERQGYFGPDDTEYLFDLFELLQESSSLRLLNNYTTTCFSSSHFNPTTSTSPTNTYYCPSTSPLQRQLPVHQHSQNIDPSTSSPEPIFKPPTAASNSISLTTVFFTSQEKETYPSTRFTPVIQRKRQHVTLSELSYTKRPKCQTSSVYFDTTEIYANPIEASPSTLPLAEQYTAQPVSKPHIISNNYSHSVQYSSQPAVQPPSQPLIHFQPLAKPSAPPIELINSTSTNVLNNRGYTPNVVSQASDVQQNYCIVPTFNNKVVSTWNQDNYKEDSDAEYESSEANDESSEAEDESEDEHKEEKENINQNTSNRCLIS